MNITILGHVCIDKNTSENSSYTAAGSPAVFMDKIFKQLPDNQVTIISPYGTDFLQYKKPASIYPEIPIGDKTLIYENMTRQGLRQQKAHNMSCAKPVPLDTKIKEILFKSDIVIIAPLTANYSPKYLKDAFLYTKPGVLKVLLPQGYCRKFDAAGNVQTRSFAEASRILPLVDIVIISEQDYPDILSLSKKWSGDYKITIVITLGEKGAVVVTPDREIQIPTQIVPENEIVDSVGSGDIFSAGFAYRYQQSHDLKKAGVFANELARQCLFFASSDIKIDFDSLS